MRKILMFLLAFMLLIPIGLSAKEIKVTDVISVDLNEEEWYIFTRDNIQDNPDLKELNISSDYMKNLFTTNDCYLDALTFLSEDTSNFIEMFVQIKGIEEKDTIDYLGYYSKSEIKDLAKEVAKTVNTNKYSIYENDKYTFIKLEYVSSSVSLIHYYTVINNKGYNIKFQKMKDFTEAEKKQVENILDKIKLELPEKTSRINGAIEGVVIAAIIGGAVIGITNLSKKKKLNEETNL